MNLFFKTCTGNPHWQKVILIFHKAPRVEFEGRQIWRSRTTEVRPLGRNIVQLTACSRIVSPGCGSVLALSFSVNTRYNEKLDDRRMRNLNSFCSKTQSGNFLTCAEQQIEHTLILNMARQVFFEFPFIRVCFKML